MWADTKGMPPPPYQRNNLTNPAPMASDLILSSSQIISSNLLHGNFVTVDANRRTPTRASGSVMGSNLILTSAGLINYDPTLSTVPIVNMTQFRNGSPAFLTNQDQDKNHSRQVSFEDENGFTDGARPDNNQITRASVTNQRSKDISNNWKKVRAISKATSLDRTRYQDFEEDAKRKRTRNQRALTIQIDDRTRRSPSPIQCQVHPKMIAINNSVSLDID